MLVAGASTLCERIVVPVGAIRTSEANRSVLRHFWPDRILLRSKSPVSVGLQVIFLFDFFFFLVLCCVRSGMPMCDFCNGLFKDMGALASHRRWKHVPAVQPGQGISGGTHTYPDCGNAFNSAGGLNVHHRAKHPDVYHAARQPAAWVKARWSHEELVLVARAELEIRGTNPPQGVLRVLHSRFPNRTLEANQESA